MAFSVSSVQSLRGPRQGVLDGVFQRGAVFCLEPGMNQHHATCRINQQRRRHRLDSVATRRIATRIVSDGEARRVAGENFSASGFACRRSRRRCAAPLPPYFGVHLVHPRK